MEELKACRFCLTKDDPNDKLFHLFDNKLGSIQVWSISCCGIELCEGTETAPFICTSCLQIMEAFHQYKQICKKTDTALKMYFMTKNLPEAFPLPIDKLANVILTKSTATKETKDAECQATEVKVTFNKEVQAQIVEQMLQPRKVSTGKEKTDISHVKDIQILEDIRIEPGHASSTKQNRKSKEVEMKKIPYPKERSTKQKLMTTKCTNKRPSQANTVPPKPPKREKITSSTDNIQFEIVNEPKLLNKTDIIVAQSMDDVRIKTLKVDGNEARVAVEFDTINNEIYPCSYCSRSFPLRQQLELHEQTHFRERKFACDSCDSRFLSKHDLAKHMMSHSNKSFVCQICKKAFSRNNILKQHQEKQHAELMKYRCDQCDKRFMEIDELKQHFTVAHNKVRRFKCKCGKQFAYKQGLERHEVIHNKEAHDHTCEHCNESFPTVNKLSRHLLATHTGARRYPCKYCPKKFLMSHHLSRHMKSHINGTARNDQMSFTITEVQDYKEAEEGIENFVMYETQSQLLTNEVHYVEIEEVVIKDEC